MKEWNEYYSDVNKEWYLRHVKAVKGFAHRIAKFTPEYSGILEVGFGTGQISIYLSLMKDKHYDCYGLDSNKVQVERADKLAKELNADVMFCHGDVFELTDKSYGFIHTVFSQGLLEHFESYDIKALFETQFRVGKVVAFSVPLDKFGHQSRGDEILRPEKEWKEFVEPYKILYWETYAKGTQLMGVLKK
jgi:ubiquinone/menaquinone biosynthesis C-methylase UbiE